MLVALLAALVVTVTACAGGSTADEALYAELFEVDADPTTDSIEGVYVIQSTSAAGELYVHSMEEQSRVRVAVDGSSFHMAARCLDGIIIGATVEAELEVGRPDHLRFSGEDVTSRQEASGIRCRVALGRDLWGGRAPVEVDGLTVVITSGDDPTSYLKLRKISDWPAT